MARERRQSFKSFNRESRVLSVRSSAMRKTRHAADIESGDRKDMSEFNVDGEGIDDAGSETEFTPYLLNEMDQETIFT